MVQFIWKQIELQLLVCDGGQGSIVAQNLEYKPTKTSAPGHDLFFQPIWEYLSGFY